jgi:hypothetical protein
MEGGGSTPWTAALPPERPSELIVEEAGLAPGPFWTGTEKRKSPAPTGVQTPDRSASSKSYRTTLFRLVLSKHRQSKVKVNFTLKQATKAQSGRRDITLLLP